MVLVFVCFMWIKLLLTSEGVQGHAGLRGRTGVESIGQFPDLAGLLPNQRLHREGVSPGTQTLHVERGPVSSTRLCVYPRELLESQLTPHRCGRLQETRRQRQVAALRSQTLRGAAQLIRCVLTCVPGGVRSVY